MKLKDVCTLTGLSRKTIRLYEEKGLIQPQKNRRNGRDYREYTDADVEMLRVVASLRRAWFTIDEIRRMQEDPAAIREIFPQYRQWLLAQAETLEGLLQASETVRPEQVANLKQLSEMMEPAAGKLPLPTYDVQPRFRYLDALEEPPRPDSISEGGTCMQYNDITGGNDLIAQDQKDRMYRQFVADSSKDHHDNLAVAFGQLHEAMDQDAAHKKPRSKALSPGVLTGILAVAGLFLALLIYGFAHPSDAYFSALAEKGTTSQVSGVEIAAQYLNGFTERDAMDAANVILEEFPETFRDCTLLTLRLDSDRSLTPQELRFTGEMRSGKYLSTSIGVDRQYQEYNVTWVMRRDQTGWVIMIYSC